MKVSKDLLERYHQGLCSPDEQKTVEQWLLDDDDDSHFPDHLPDKNLVKEEIWQQVQSDTIMADPSDLSTIVRKKPKKTYWAAAAAIVLLVTSLFVFRNGKGPDSTVVQSRKMKGLNTELFDIEFGNESRATFDRENEMVDFCGIIKITPKKSMKLSFSNYCGNHEELKREMHVTGGTTYFALDLKNNHHTELLVMNEDLLFELPPLLRNSLIKQFGI